MCDLFASISWLISDAVVVFAGERSLAYNYNIRHAILHEILTFTTYKFMTVWAVATGLFLWYYINKYEILTSLWAVKYTVLGDSLSSKLWSDCEIIWAVYKLRDSSDGSGSQSSVFYGWFWCGNGRCDYKNR